MSTQTHTAPGSTDVAEAFQAMRGSFDRPAANPVRRVAAQVLNLRQSPRTMSSSA